MDASNVVNAFVACANQYSLSQNEDNMKQFQRHLEILVCLTAEEANLSFFQNRSLLSSQCITHVVNVLLDSGSVKLPLLTRSLTMLRNLTANSNLIKSLQCTFHVHSALSIFLQRHGINTKDTLVIQCLQLLELVTYNIKIDYLENHFENFIEILFNSVNSDSSQILKSALHILSNICRHNYKVQAYICSLPNIKQIFKRLATIINTQVPSSILYALSILSSITPHNNLGVKLWTEEHLMLTFDIIMKLMFCEDHSSVTTAVDLFMDMIKVPKYQFCITKSPNLNRCLKKISKALHQASFKHSLVYLKFLHSLTMVPEITEKVHSILCSPETIKFDQDMQVLKIHPKLTQWCIQRDEIPTSVTTTSLQLMKSILSVHADGNFHQIEETMKDVLGNILKTICVVPDTDDSNWNEHLLVKQASFDLLILLCEKSNLKQYVSETLNAKSIETLLKSLLNDSLTDNNCYEPTIDLFLLIAEIILLLSNTSSDFNQLLDKLLQDDEVMHYLAFALTSNKKERISKSLSLLSKSSGKCSLNILSESLLTRNSNNFSQFSQKSDSGVFLSNSSLPTNSRNSIIRGKCNENTIDVLMNKIENGFQIKDLKSSEIMELYEHKIALLTLKEQELQNYVNAKSVALQEADRVITHYKCRQADIDAEALRLRSMMKDYECRCEMSAAQLSCEEQKRRKLESDFSQACHKIRELEQNANEQRELSQTQVNRLMEQKKNVEDEKVRLSEQISIKDQEKKMLMNQLQQNEEELRMKNKGLEDLQESKEDLIKVLEETRKSAEKSKLNSEQRQLQLQSAIDAAQQTISSMEEKNEALMNEMARKTEEFLHRIGDLTSEGEQLVEQLKLKDLKIEDLNANMVQLNENLHVKICIIQENEAALSKLKVTIEQIEAQRNKLKQDKGMLELLCKKYEASIEDKDSEIQRISGELEVLRKEFDESSTDKNGQIQHLKDELEKHKYITEMIHNMTSGRAGLPK